MKNVYQENGFANRNAYLDSLALEFDVDRERVYFLADILGPSEDFDRLITSLEDYQEENEARE